MSEPEFVHLHVHSQYSLLDGVSHFGPLFKEVKAQGMKSVALTDHGNLFGCLQFYKQARKEGVRPIIGCEVYVSPTTHTDRTSAEARKVRHHLILLAKNYTGYLNLCRLVSKGFLEGFYHRPRISKELLSEHSEGLIATSACLSGPISYYLQHDRIVEAEKNCADYLDIMGKDHFYVELMDHGLREQKGVNEELIRIARKNNLQMIATNDAHYVHERDAKIQDMLIAIGTGKTLNDPNRLRFEVEEFYLKRPSEMERAFGNIEGAMSNTLAIAELCETEIKLGQSDLMPEYTPPDRKKPEVYLRELVDQGLKDRYGDVTTPLRARADYELGIIEQMGFVSYFLVVWDFIDFAFKNDIAVGPGRGSGAGSIVAYSLRITDLDPIENGLFFERFLNPERVSMPDFDIDFCPLRREEVIQYVRDKYGHGNVANIITFGKMMAKAAVRDVGRVMSMPLDIVNRVAKMIPDGPKVTIAKSLESSKDFKEIYKSDPKIKELVDRACRVEGSVRNTGMHAAGVVVSSKPLIDTLPLFKAPGKDEILTQYTMKEVEEIGLLKIDFLGLKNLTVIEDCIRLVQEDFDVDLSWPEIGFEDEKTFALLQRGDGFGVFQVESSGMRDMLRKARPTCFEDITALIALYRPGPMEYIGSFCDRKHGVEPITYLHPDMKESLEETYGVMVYQEQVMQIAQKLANFTLGKADILRRAMGKKDPVEMKRMHKEFNDGCAENGIEDSLASRIFENIEKFASYAFNKAHAAAYAVVTFRTAYLKANYSAQYMAALLTNEIRTGTSDKLGLYIGVARDMGLQVLQPDVNLSQALFSVSDGHIRFGLAGIKNVGHSAVAHLQQVREADGVYEGLQDFCARVDTSKINVRAIECMIKAGAFDSLEGTRPQKLAVLGEALEMGADQRELRESGQTSLFDMMGDDAGAEDVNTIRFPLIADWTDREKLDNEKELAGIFLSGHPLDRYRPDMVSFADTSGGTLAQVKNDEQVRMVGLVTSCREILTKKGDPMAFVEIEDFEGKWECVIFPRTYEKARDILLVDNALFIEGKASRRDSDETTKVLVDRATRVEDLRRARVKFIDIEIAAAAIEVEHLEALRSLLREHSGKIPLRLCIFGEQHQKVTMQAHARFRVTPSDAFLKDIDALDFPKRLIFSER